MALIWSSTRGETLYQIRTAGASVRLYTNGIFHSQFNSNLKARGDLWEMLALPYGLIGQQAKRPRILVLGVGGGAVLRWLLAMNSQVELVAVELDRTHIQIAKKYFGLKNKAEFIHADAIEWVKRYSGPKFDWVIDDLFIEGQNIEVQNKAARVIDPQRAIEINAPWLFALKKLIKPKGIVSFNLAGRDEYNRLKKLTLKRNGQHQLDGKSPGFNFIAQIFNNKYENLIAVLGSSECTKNELMEAIASTPLLGSGVTLRSGFKPGLASRVPRHRGHRSTPPKYHIQIGKFPT